MVPVPELDTQKSIVKKINTAIETVRYLEQIRQDSAHYLASEINKFYSDEDHAAKTDKI